MLELLAAETDLSPQIQRIVTDRPLTMLRPTDIVGLADTIP